MKRVIFVLFILLSSTFQALSQTAPDAPELTRLLNEFLAGAGRSDAAVHDRFWAEDLIYTRSSGVRTNKPELMKGVRAAPPAKPEDPVTVYTAEDIRIQQYAGAAVVAFKLVGNTTKADGTKTVSNHLNTGTFIKRNGKWQVVAWQATTVPEPKPDTKATSQSTVPEQKTLVLTPKLPPPTPGRTYLKGTRGGCYYLNSKGAKVYVDHAYCK
jgi:hypothetical protein